MRSSLHNMAFFKTVTNADEALHYLKHNKVDVVLLDLIITSEESRTLQSGDELLRELYQWEDKPKVIILSKIDSLDMLDYCIEQLEADGYILKSGTSLSEIIPAINAVIEDEHYFSTRIKKLLKYKFGLLELGIVDRIILRELGKGNNQIDISKTLIENGFELSRSAVEKRVRKLRIRFEAKNIPHLIANAMKNGII